MNGPNDDALIVIRREIQELFIQLEAIKEALVYMEKHYAKSFYEVNDTAERIKSMLENSLYKNDDKDDEGIKSLSSEVHSLHNTQEKMIKEMNTMSELVRLLVLNNLVEEVRGDADANIVIKDSYLARKMSECIMGLYKKYKKNSNCQIAEFLCNDSITQSMAKIVYDNMDFYEETEVIVAIFRDYEYNYAAFTDKAFYIKSSMLNTYRRIYKMKYSKLKEVVSVGRFEVTITGEDDSKQRRINFVGLDSRVVRGFLNDAIIRKYF